MDIAEFVQNIKKYCDIKGTKPTIACKESGAGKDLINQIERRGSMPSVEKVQQLASYLGVTVSELLGEEKGSAVPADVGDIQRRFDALSPEAQREVLSFIEFKESQG